MTNDGKNTTTKSWKTLGVKEIYKYLGRLETDPITHVKMKEIFEKEYLRSTRKLRKTKLQGTNLVKGINT